jgi:hypothetical protein
VFEDHRRETFGHHVRELLTGRDIENSELPELNTFTKKVNVQLNVLGALVMNRIRRHVHSGHIVAKDHGHLADGATEFIEELAEPNAFGHRICHRTVLCFGARVGHHGLAFRRPRHERIANIDAIA